MDSGKKIQAQLNLKVLRRDYGSRLAAAALPPVHVPVVGGQEKRKYTVFQELYAIRQEIQDEFSRGQLELKDLSARLDSEAAASGALPDGPAKPEIISGAPVRFSVEPVSAARPALPPWPAAEPRSEIIRRGNSGISKNLKVLTLVLLAAAAGAWLLLGSKSGADAVFPMPLARAAGLCRGGDNLYFSDPQRQLLFTVAAGNGQVKGVRALRVLSLAGLAYDGKVFWSSGLNGLARHEAAGQYQVEKYYPEAGAGTGALHWDGKLLWVAAMSGHTITSYFTGDKLRQAAVYTVPSALPAGFHILGKDLYIIEEFPPRLVKYDLGRSALPVSEAALGKFVSRNAKITGLEIDSSFLWLMTGSPAELSRVKTGSLAFVPAKL